MGFDRGGHVSRPVELVDGQRRQRQTIQHAATMMASTLYVNHKAVR